MTDRPRFDVDDTTSSYSPPPSTRPRWVDQGWGTTSGAPAPAGTPPPAGTPTWYDPTWQTAREGGSGKPVKDPGPSRQTPSPAPSNSGGGGRGRGVLGTTAVALFAGVAGAALTVGVLGAGGWIVRPSTVPATNAPLQTAAGDQVTPRLEATDIVAAVSRISPTVVTITSRAAAGDLVPTDPFSLPATGVGSGIIYSDTGLVLTARHVVCGADALTVKLPDGREFGATTYGIDTLTDLAIVQIDPGAENLPVARVGDSSALEQGQVAIAIGSPMGTYTNSVTSGVISATGRDVAVTEQCGAGGERILRNLIQTDAAINPGNSGGPLVDGSGRVIGISTAVSGEGQGIGFAIPINIARPIMDQAVEGYKPLTRPWMGVFYEPVTPALVSSQDLPVDYGVLVSKPAGTTDPAVVADSPAAVAGLQEGDLVTSINGDRIDALHPLDDLLSQYQRKDTITLSVLRGGQTMTLRLTLGERPAEL